MTAVLAILLTLTLVSVTVYIVSASRKKQDNTEKEENRLLRKLVEHVGSIDHTLRVLLEASPILTIARCVIMPKAVNVGDSFNAAIAGLDQLGQPFPLDGSYSVVYGASNPGAVQLPSPPQPDGSGVGTAVAADPAESISATITGPNGLVVSATADTLTINEVVAPPVLTSASVVIT